MVRAEDFPENERCPWCGRAVGFSRSELTSLAADGVNGEFDDECPWCGKQVTCNAWYEPHAEVVGRG